MMQIACRNEIIAVTKDGYDCIGLQKRNTIMV